VCNSINLFKLSKKLNKIPNKTETKELINTSLAVDNIAFNTEWSESDITKSEYISITFGNFSIAGLNSFSRLKRTAKNRGSTNSPKKKTLIFELDCFINSFVYF